MSMMNKCAKFHKDSPSDKKWNSFSRAQLNFRRGPIVCTTFYRNLMPASNFGGTFDQLFLWIFSEFLTEDTSLLLLYHGAKRSKMTIKLNSRGPSLIKVVRESFGSNKMCELFCQNLLFMTQAVRKWNNIRGSPCSIFHKHCYFWPS